MNYYEVLGVEPEASTEDVRDAYDRKLQELEEQRRPDAPRDVQAAAGRAATIYTEAFQVLSDIVLRGRFDATLHVRDGDARISWRLRRKFRKAERIWKLERELGHPLSSVYGLDPPAPRTPSKGRDGLSAAVMSPSEDNGYGAGLEEIATWLAPTHRAPRHVAVPDVCGMRASEAYYEIAKSDLHVEFVLLTDRPAPQDGVVVGQDPPSGTEAPRHSTVRVQVMHPEDVIPGKSTP